MDDATADGVLAYIAYRRETERRRGLLLDVLLMHWRASGKIPDDAAVWAAFDAIWVPATPEHVANLVAAKCNAAVEYHDGELVWATEEVAKAEAKDARWGSMAEAAGFAATAFGDNARTEDQAGKISERRAAAQALLERALAAGGDPQAAPGEGPTITRLVPAEVAEAADRLLASKE
jgi:hypothetical protein